ncbi:30S ribosomal protein S2 [candidate division KSB1 bacterium]
MTDISLQEMVKHAVHFGHPTHKWNPKMKPYLYGKRYGIHIFDLKKTAESLLKALDFLANASRANKTILFVGTKQQSHPMLQDIQKSTRMPIVTDKWIPGLLTNFKTIKKRIDYFKELKSEDSGGGFEKYTKKEQLKLRKKIQDLSASLTGVEDMKEVPDILFVVDIVRDHIAVKEARRLKMPVIAIVDSNADPDIVDYPIPANDDAIKSLEYILSFVKEAITAKPKQ